ncbi:MAG: peptide deformylase [Candidatus Uhrbacteria bacterium]|nr:peptide deformylase [Candidatus Uhrbacteria bacterium]
MTHHKLTQFGNPILRKKAKAIPLKKIRTTSFKKLIGQMFGMIQDIGVGLAAPQIGKSIRLAVIDIHPLPHRPQVEPIKRVLINPKILSCSRVTESDYEGCLSFDGVRGSVPRAKRVTVCYYNEKGEKRTETATGFFAKVLQHEIDHLNGVLYVDRMKDMRTLMTADEYSKRT